MIAAALIVIVAAVMLVRLGWGGRRGAAALGWGGLIAGLTALTMRDGAWGMAIGTVAGIATAFVVLAYQGWMSPAKAVRPARAAPSVVLPYRWSDLGRRVAVFVLVVPCAFAAAQWLAFGIQAAARGGGAGDADTIVLTLFLQPLLWTTIMAWQMTRTGPAGMLAPPVVAAVLGTALWGMS